MYIYYFKSNVNYCKSKYNLMYMKMQQDNTRDPQNVANPVWEG